jgi:hypothetical protein
VFHITNGWRSVRAVGLVLALAAASIGCGGQPKGDVSGKVKFKGEAIPSGRITFQSQAGRHEVHGSLIRNGSYSVRGLPLGPAAITVETFPITPDTKSVPKGFKVDGKKALEPREQLQIPERYKFLSKSGLTYTVEEGSQTKDFDLPP